MGGGGREGEKSIRHKDSKQSTSKISFNFIIFLHPLRPVLLYLPACLVEHFDLIARSFWVSDHQSRSNDIEGGIDVHRIGVIEAQNMDPILVTQVTSHPFNPKVVGHLQLLW